MGDKKINRLDHKIGIYIYTLFLLMTNSGTGTSGPLRQKLRTLGHISRPLSMQIISKKVTIDSWVSRHLWAI